MEIDRTNFPSIILNLFENAVKYSPGNTKIILSLKKQSNKIVLTLTDEGTGVPENEKKNVDLIREDYTRQKKYSTAFVEKMSRLVSECFQAWQQAKEKDDFSLYANQLEKLIDLKREEAELLGYKEHPYDAMLNLYEKGLTSKEVDVLFADVRKQLVPFVKKIAEAKQVDDDFFYKKYEKDK